MLCPGLLDRQSLKSSLLPKIRQVCLTTGLLSVRVNSLICIGKLLEHMDKWQVIDDVLSWMSQIPSKVLQCPSFFFMANSDCNVSGACCDYGYRGHLQVSCDQL